ncbi:MAG: hypothetical protein K0B87_02770 [Candidatus Syntrophosphaera sp.]|nr:hypothetical protein [Candidatus Syntrophosphaera sp.]
MRWILILAFLPAVVGLAAQSADSLDFPLPHYVNPIFDSFTRNYVSTSAMGRGYTGVSVPGGIDNVLLNPAGYVPDKATLHIEMLVKPPVDAKFYAEHDTLTGITMTPEDRMTSPVPLGIVGGGGSISQRFTYALLYAMPKTIRVDDFSVEMNMGAYLLSRYPSFYLHQFTANAAWHTERFHVGLNLHNQIYRIGDVTFLRSFERINDSKYLLRPQLGLLYTGDSFNVGLSAIPRQNASWDLKFAQYDTHLPLNLAAGGAYKTDSSSFAAELDYEQTSTLSDKYIDRYTLKLGAETTVRKFTYRAGYIYHPEIWHGHYKLPDAASDTLSIWWNDVLAGGKVEKNTQHILTLGMTWHGRDARINLGFLMDVAGRAPIAQVNASLDLYFSAFRKKNFLFFD